MSMKSSHGVLRGSSEPTFCVYPEYEDTDILDCIDLNVAGGLNPFDWQVNVLEPWLGRTADGKWSAPTCGLSVPRQNGKSLGVVAARINYGMVVLGESVVYTAHLQKTATETFELLREFYETPKMKKRVKAIKSALGREEIDLKNGARIKFLARTRNGGRGQHGDLLIFDEAQELDSKQQASFTFAISASRNPQTLYLGTPPDELSVTEVFRGIRNRAIKRQGKRLAWAEWSVPEVPEDITDTKLWELTNPSLGITIQPSTIEAEVDQMMPEDFARERLGWWVDGVAGDCVIPANDWEECRTFDPPQPMGDEKMAAGIKFTADGAKVALSVAVKQGERAYVECLDYAPMNRGVKWLAEWISDRRDKLAMVYIDGKSNTGALVAKLNEADYPDKGFKVMGTSDVISASSMFANAVSEHEVEHSGQPLLDESVTHVVKRKIGADGGWGFGNGAAECAPAESAAFAYMAVMTTRRNPNRKMRVG